MHSDISKKDNEHSKNFCVVIVLYNPYNREKEYKGLNRTITPVIYLKLWTIRGRHHAYIILPLTHPSNE